MKASDLFVKCLENEGVEYIFGLPGEENIDMIHSLKESSIKFIVTHHEQSAAFMADVYGRLTGKPGVCLGTLGPGATNLLTGVANANLDYAPLIAITGQSSDKHAHKALHQYIDVIRLYDEVTKWNYKIEHPGLIPEIVRKAFRTAVTERPGAVQLELPEDMVVQEVDGKPLPLLTVPETIAAKKEIEKAAQLIDGAEKPLLLAGNGVIRGNASESLRGLVEKGGIPVINTFMAKGVLPSDHELYLHTAGLQRDYPYTGLQEADLVIAVGFDFIEFQPERWNDKHQPHIIHINYEPAGIDQDYLVSAELVGELNDSLQRLTQKIEPSELWQEAIKLRERKKSLFQHREDDHMPMHPERILNDLKKAEEGKAIILSDVGAHKLWLARMYETDHPNHMIISNGLASMGIAIPGAISAKLSHPDTPVIAVMGDGGFLINGVELLTAKRLGLNLIVLIFNDSKYGLIHWHQMEKFHESNGVRFKNPNFVDYVGSLGIKGHKIKKAEEFLPELRNALQSDEIVVFDIDVDYSDNLKKVKGQES